MQMVLLQTSLCVAQDLDVEGNVDGDSVNAYVGSFGAEGLVADSFSRLRFFGLEGAVNDCAGVVSFGVEGTVADSSSVALDSLVLKVLWLLALALDPFVLRVLLQATAQFRVFLIFSIFLC